MILKDKVTVVTGGANGIGNGLVRGFASQGSRVAILDIDKTKSLDLAAALTRDGFSVEAFRVDVSDPASVGEAVDSVLDRLGAIDILINNAGIYPRKRWDEMTLQDWDHIHNTNLRSCFICSKAVYPSMKEKRWGRIISLSSVTFWLGMPRNLVHYISSKGGVIGFTRALAREVGEYNITVNAITPGAVETEGEKSVVSEKDLQTILGFQSLKLRVLPEDIARTALFLASDWAKAITGQSINVDGGWYMH